MSCGNPHPTTGAGSSVVSHLGFGNVRIGLEPRPLPSTLHSRSTPSFGFHIGVCCPARNRHNCSLLAMRPRGCAGWLVTAGHAAPTVRP